MNKVLLATVIILSQLFFVNVSRAEGTSSAQVSSISGFVFQDNDANGLFDDDDNVFPAASVSVQIVDSDLIQTLLVESPGYFEIVDLEPGKYYVWASYYGVDSKPSIVDVSAESLDISVTLGISTPIMDINSNQIPERTSDTDSEIILLPFIAG